MKTTIYFDMDGTLVDLYGIQNWLNYLKNEDPYPYKAAKAKIRLATVARLLNQKQKQGYNVAVLTWTGKNATQKYNEQVTQAKQQWLKKHLKTVKFNKLIVIPYGTPKEQYKQNPQDILFDDEPQNRTGWGAGAYDENRIIEVLKNL